MKVSILLAAVGAVLALSAGAALAAEGCECCKDMAVGAEMSCCDKVEHADSVPQPPQAPAPSGDAPAAPAPSPQSS